MMMSDKLRAAAQEARQCPSCGGGCKKSGCERENLKMNPEKREWFGLTDEEITELHHEVKVRLMGAYKAENIYRAIEAKLKEKNT